MPTKLNQSISVATLTALCMMAGVARSDEGATDDLYQVSASVTGDGYGAAQPATCQEQRESAWFLHELSRTDGDTEPAAPAATCHADRYAESSAISD